MNADPIYFFRAPGVGQVYGLPPKFEFLLSYQLISLALRKSHTLRVSENGILILRIMFGPKKNEVRVGRRLSHMEELYDVYFLAHFSRMLRIR
jgi:hypothetical protein